MVVMLMEVVAGLTISCTVALVGLALKLVDPL